MTHRDIAVVAAEEDLIALGHNVSLRTDAGIGRGLSSAVADGFDLGNGVGQLEKPHTSGKQLRLEIRPQAEAQNGQILPVDELTQLIDLRRRHKLALVDDDHIGLFPRVIERTDVLVRADSLALG